MKSIFILDDHPVVRLAVRMLLEGEGYGVVGECDNGVDGMQMIRDTQPQLLILDISLPRLDGLELLSRYHAMGSPLRTLVLTAQSPALFAIRCMQAGACGYVRKQEELSELLSAVRAVMAGYNYFPSQALRPGPVPPWQQAELALFERVNDRELMVLQMFSQGRSNKEIAASMFISGKTVSTYKKRLMHKLRAGSLVELIDIAKRNELV
ncbi:MULTISPECIES: response regulator transcription factor [unclassified Pseudomonas]|uniref:response regulator transcription factor n=1 Tax=unclassified Pseudomonas TaxID=196821 RepID=UPI000BC3A23B|nr:MULTISPECIES: response regulator transcription factor [unclassified Pseudomonas]PVZ20365.1 LuxR family two component transcriptional regulator [Pseudomonas sp. URIL14HWK12:I12]PVZ27431.1 LuxR family two component transcriptional regulator [Pseudomonas sp. URIL14HWK12:I10]PVZ38320.1 LuxR family two component transcriptional regulator [Pseudomonas sp. URIL14HWK12:I11]SNZ03829.1 two component transcriptional regulator, LuxR family [Pseudomonas sp. URIL14HWK12:I9]